MKIESGIIRPDGGKERKTKYPFKNMNVGDSFFMEGFSHTIQKNILNAGARYAEYNGLSWKFSTRKEGTGIRVWRIV